MSKTLLYSLIGIVVIAIIGVSITLARKPRTAPSEQTASIQGQSQYENESLSATEPVTNSVTWQQGQDGWKATSTAPACPDPLTLPLPADITKATGVLYPGQTRGGNYKPHGGLRFDNTQNDEVSVTSPMDGVIVRGSQYLVNGEMQYTFDIINECGIMHRLGHFLVLAPKFQEIANTFPAASENSSQTTSVDPPVTVSAGEVLATAVGVTKGGVNTFFDWGVYDLRSKNEISQNATWAKEHEQDKELAPHAVCWFDWLSAANAAKVRSLPPGDPASGKTSDYCK